jgi:hypothetical protein
MENSWATAMEASRSISFALRQPTPSLASTSLEVLSWASSWLVEVDAVDGHRSSGNSSDSSGS